VQPFGIRPEVRDPMVKELSHGMAAGGWTAGSSLYSGRVDPVWQVSRGGADSLVRCIGQLPPVANAAAPQPPGLGYRGSWLRAPDGRRWHFFGGQVQAGNTRLRDPERNCERQILKTAPAGVLPPELI
jgi:hypothetical protein